VAAAAAGALLLFGTGVTVAAGSALPGEPLYPVKLAVEEARLAAARAAASPEAQAAVLTELAERLVEFAQAAATGVLAGLHPWGATAHSEAQRAAIERAWGRPYDEAAERNARVRAFALDRADAARALLPQMG
jgi:hypothetical protein